MSQNNEQSNKVIIGLSGGVDSAVTAALLQEQGYTVEAVFMQNWDNNDPNCTASADLSDARAVCDQLNIPLTTVDYSQQYWDNVFSHCLDEFAAGRTPNPDVLCNREIKFSPLLEYAKSTGASHLATGHYAQIKKNNGIHELHKGLDPLKDQTYFLYLLNQQQLASALFPLGELKKTSVREKASQLKLKNASKKDSTGICFVGERRFKPFLQEFLLAQPGTIEDTTGKNIGEHDGVIFYTIGQRQGLQIGGQQDGTGEPWYVIGKDTTRNVLVVGQGAHHPDLYRNSCQITNLHWIDNKQHQEPINCHCKLRHRHADQSCKITPNGNNNAIVEFNEPQRAVTPGQSVVLYDGTRCLGGGIVI